MPPTIPALKDLQRRYCGRAKPVDPTPIRQAQDLLRGKFRSIHPIVDVYNLWSARLGLSIGAFDLDRIQGSISVKVTNGSERFRPIGATEQKEKLVEPGGFAYVDDSGEVLCWLDIRQGESTKLTAATRKALLLIEGVQPLTAGELNAFGKQIADSLLETGGASDVKVCPTKPVAPGAESS
jgi:DNA/RNA-binding domain of Phe-tRNA-synthetase-like protein